MSMLQDLIKTTPDWHLKINANNAVIGDKLTPAADVVFDAGLNRYILTLRNLPPDVVSGLPATLPDMFGVICRMPNAFASGALFRIGATDFAPRDAAFAAGDVVTVNFDRNLNICFFTSGGGASIEPVSFVIPATAWTASAAHGGFDFEARLAVAGLLPTDLIRADFDMTSLSIAEFAGVAPAGETEANTAIFYAEIQPDGDLSGMYTVFRGAV